MRTQTDDWALTHAARATPSKALKNCPTKSACPRRSTRKSTTRRSTRARWSAVCVREKRDVLLQPIFLCDCWPSQRSMSANRSRQRANECSSHASWAGGVENGTASLPACNIALFGNYLRNQSVIAKYPRLIACTFSFVSRLEVR